MGLRNRTIAIVIMATLTLALVSPLVLKTYADELTNRSLAITSSTPGGAADHLYSFDYISASNVGSVVFEYCSNTAIIGSACTPPIGLNVGSTSLVFQSGESGFGIHPFTTDNRIVISRPSVAVTPGSAQYLFQDAINHNQANRTTYVRIYTHASIDGTGPYTDAGAVAFTTASKLTVGAYIPPFLIFCVGVTVAIDCSTATGNFIQLGELRPSSPSIATSQYSGGTNDFTGYSVSIYGTTMTSGNNTIPALSSPSGAVTGTSQFGINLRDNSVPDVGIEPVGPGTATVAPGYNSVNSYKFASGDTLSSVGKVSNYDRFTVSYLVNVSNGQPAGIYNSTFTYIAVAAF